MREGENKVNMLQSSRSDQLLAYGAWMPSLVKAVKGAESQFRKPPKGPIGVCFIADVMSFSSNPSLLFFLALPPSLPPLSLSSIPSSCPSIKGAMIKLHDYRWSVAIEAIIGKDLSAFVVDNTYDRATLQRLMSGVLKGQRSPDVLTSRYTVRIVCV